MTRRLALLLAAVAGAQVCASGAAGGGLSVGRVRWGFDGRVVPGRLNLLSVEVTNTGRQFVRAHLRLVRGFQVGGRLGAPLERPCYLSPGATRWVQFVPYIHAMGQTWHLEGGSQLRVKLTEPKLGPPARVFLRDPEAPVAGVRLPVLPDPLFPVTVAATDGLHSVVLDHAPPWSSPARRRAFVDWLRRGGQLHLLHDYDGRYPVFTDELAALNTPQRRFRVGAGRVIRHPRRRHQVTPAWLAERGFPLPELKKNLQGELPDPTGSLLRALSGASRPRHLWPLIYLAALAYIGFLGIYHFFYARKRGEWQRPMLVFGASVLGCSLLFGLIGKRGQGESAAVHSVAYARHLGGNRFDVTQWQSAFVTRGDIYQITHPAPHNLYSTCQTEEPVRGVIRNGKEGAVQVDMPLFSSRAYLHRGVLQGHRLSFRLREWRGDETLEALTLEVGDGFPTDARAVYALYRDHFRPMRLQGDELRLGSGGGKTEAFLRHRDLLLSDPWAETTGDWDNP
ncbi:MAG: hypothetical protein ACODAJ_08295, partial [Planctomycetota bacterium]